MYTNVSRYPGTRIENSQNITSAFVDSRVRLPVVTSPKLDTAVIWYDPNITSVEYSPDGLSKKVLQFSS